MNNGYTIQMHRRAEDALQSLSDRDRDRVYGTIGRLAAGDLARLPRLRPLHGRPGLYELRVGREFRLLFQVDVASRTITLQDIVNHEFVKHYLEGAGA